MEAQVNKLLFSIHRSDTATRNAVRRKFGEKECLNNRFLLPSLLYAGYSIKLKKKLYKQKKIIYC